MPSRIHGRHEASCRLVTVHGVGSSETLSVTGGLGEGRWGGAPPNAREAFRSSLANPSFWSRRTAIPRSPQSSLAASTAQSLPHADRDGDGRVMTPISDPAHAPGLVAARHQHVDSG